MRVMDLPADRQPAQYEIINDGLPKAFTVSKRKRQVLDLLMSGPFYCASPVRLSDVVFLLKEETGIVVETKMYPGDPVIGSGAYGVYFLRSEVSRLPEGRIAA